MSRIEYSLNETPLIKNGLIMSDLNIYGNDYIPLKEEEKNEEKYLSEDSNFQNFIKKEFEKEMTKKNNISFIYDDLDDIRRYEIPTFKPLPNPNIIFNNNLKASTNFFSNFNTLNISNDNNPINKTKQNKIFKIEKNNFKCLNQKRIYGEKTKKIICDWDNIKVPKEKHFHFDRKKHRIVFQRKHLKVIYSIVDLTYPFNFNKCFDIIKEHIGDKTVQNYKEGKSFHIIKINNEEKIVTLKDKKMLLKGNKIRKKMDINNKDLKDKNKNFLLHEIQK